MDKETIDAYNRDAENISQLHATLTPHQIYTLIDQNFIKGGNTVDLGCGSGRDTHWLNQRGYPTIGVDASEKMLNIARHLYPEDVFIQDYLPNLTQLNNMYFENILCSAVLMHLHKSDLKTACDKLLMLLNKGGRLILSFRGTNSSNKRERGKLYQPIDVKGLINIFKELGCEIIVHENEVEKARNLAWNNFVITR